MEIKIFHFLAPVADGVTIWAGLGTWGHDAGDEEEMRRSAAGQGWVMTKPGRVVTSGTPGLLSSWETRTRDSGVLTIGLTLWHVYMKCVLLHEKVASTRPVTPYLYFIFLTRLVISDKVLNVDGGDPPWSPHVVTRLWSRPSCVLSVVTPAPALHCLSCLSEMWKSKFEKQILKIILFIFQSFKKQTVRLHHWRIYKVKFNLLKHFIFNFHK